MFLSIIGFLERHEAQIVRALFIVSTCSALLILLSHVGSLIFLGQGAATTFKDAIRPLPDAAQTALRVLAIGMVVLVFLLALLLIRALVITLVRGWRFRFSQDETGVFICYSRRHSNNIDQFRDILSLVTPVFVDRVSLEFGSNWRQTIDAKIRRSRIFFVFWCKHAAESEEIAHELELAVSSGRRIVPLLLDDTPLPGAIEDIHAIYSTKDICTKAADEPAMTMVSPPKLAEIAPALNVRLPEVARPKFENKLGGVSGSHFFPAFGEVLNSCGKDRQLSISVGIGLGGMAWAVSAGLSPLAGDAGDVI